MSAAQQQQTTTTTSVLAEKDVNVVAVSSTGNVAAADDGAAKPAVKSMEFHRQVLQSKMEEAKSKTYISPSDEIMSPCTAKLTAYRNKQVGKAKPKSLFAKASAKKLGSGASLFGAKSIPSSASAASAAAAAAKDEDSSPSPSSS